MTFANEENMTKLEKLMTGLTADLSVRFGISESEAENVLCQMFEDPMTVESIHWYFLEYVSPQTPDPAPKPVPEPVRHRQAQLTLTGD